MSQWLEYRAKVTGKTVEELRQIMSERGKKNPNVFNSESAKKAISKRWDKVKSKEAKG